MAVFRPIANTTMVQVRWSFGQNQCLNTYYYRWVGPAPPTVQNLTDLCIATRDTIGARIEQASHNSVTMREVYARNMNTEIAAQATVAFANNTVGDRGGGALAGNEASQILKRSGLTGRSARNSNSHSGFAEADADGNSISSQLFAFLTNIANSVVVARVGGIFVAAVASRLLGTSVPMLTASIINNDIDSQKTRLNGRGG